MQRSVQIYIDHVNWKDPDSIKVRNIRMMKCASLWNGLLAGGGHTVAWEILFDVNGKNSYGGYTGYETKSVWRTKDRKVSWQDVDSGEVHTYIDNRSANRSGP
jgi:hypothetical protein